MIGRLFEVGNERALRAYVAPLILLLLPVVCVLLQPDVARELHRQWTTSGEIDFGYFLLAAVALFYLREVAAMKSPHPAPLWLVPALGVAVGIAIAGEIQLQAAVLVGITALWGCASLAVLGWPARNLILICSALIILATPVPFLLVPYLRELTVLFVTSLTKLVGITAYIESNLIHLPTGTIEIADGCAGEKYLRSSLIMGFAAIAMSLNRYHALVTLGLFTLAALVANWLRVFVLVVIADQTSTTNPLVLEHDWLGWSIFAGVLLALFWLVLEPQRSEAADSATQQHPEKRAETRPLPQKHLRNTVLIAALALSLSPLLTDWAFSGVPNEVAAFRSLSILENCVRSQPRDSTPVNSVESADVEIQEALRCRQDSETRTVLRYSAAFQAATRGRDLTGWLNAPLSPQGWNVLNSRTVQIQPQHRIGIVTGDRRGVAQRWAVAHWYSTADRSTPSPLELKIRSLLGRLSGHYSESATRLYMECRSECDREAELLIDLVAALLSGPEH